MLLTAPLFSQQTSFQEKKKKKSDPKSQIMNTSHIGMSKDKQLLIWWCDANDFNLHSITKSEIRVAMLVAVHSCIVLLVRFAGLSENMDLMIPHSSKLYTGIQALVEFKFLFFVDSEGLPVYVLCSWFVQMQSFLDSLCKSNVLHIFSISPLSWKWLLEYKKSDAPEW